MKVVLTSILLSWLGANSLLNRGASNDVRTPTSMRFIDEIFTSSKLR